MPSLKIVSTLLIATFAIQASFNEVRAASGPESQAFEEQTLQVSAPEETRVVSDMTSYYRFVGNAALGAEPGNYGQADSTAIRSSVRKGEVLEFRLTSVYYADSDGDLQREVDSIVSYQMDGDRWTLLGVQMEGTRKVRPGVSSESTKNC